LGRRVAEFERGYVERSAIFLWLYRQSFTFPWMRRFMLAMPISRPRMALVGRYFHQLFEDWNDGDLDPTLGLVDPAIKLTVFGLGSYEGPEGMREAWADWNRPFEGLRFEVSEVIANRGGKIATVMRVRGRDVATQIDMGQPGVMVWTVRKAIGVEARLYRTKAEALEAAGLSEDDVHSSSS
jgi:SnoaL-like protein